jgi:hypothetical protein
MDLSLENVMSNGSNRVERNETHKAIKLHMSDIPGTVQVRVGKTAAMQVQITGPEKLVEQIRREVRGDVLHISGPQLGGDGTTVISTSRGGVQTNVFSGGGRMVIQGGNFGVVNTGRGGVVIGGNVVISGGRVVSGGGDVTYIESEEVRIVVDVPRQTPITIDEGLVGSYEIGDIEGPLDLRMKGGGDVTAGRVAATRVSIQGSSDVEISAVTGRALHVSIQGSGDVTVREGQVDNLDVSVQGSGDVVYGGTAKSASLSVMGSGDIRVNEVTESLNDRSMGSGRIRVHVHPRRDPNSFWS